MRSLSYGIQCKAMLLVWGLALALTGCDTFGPGSPPSNPGVQPTAAAPLPPPPPRKPPPPAGTALARLPPAAGEVETPPVAAPLPPPPQPTALPPPPQQQLTALPPPSAPAAPAAGNLDRLIGLDQSHVAGILGSPRSRAESPPATIWRFGSANCDLDVYFYLDLQSQAMRALHYEVRSHDAPDQSAQRCYEALVDERRANAEPASGSDSSR
jgi:hypothetical protein